MFSLLFIQSHFTPLMFAADRGDCRIVKYLLKYKANTDTHGLVSNKDYLHTCAAMTTVIKQCGQQLLLNYN